MGGWARRSFLYWVQVTFQGQTVKLGGGYMFVSKHASGMIYVEQMVQYMYTCIKIWHKITGERTNLNWCLPHTTDRGMEESFLTKWQNGEQACPQHCWVENDTVSLQVVLICVLLSKRCSDIKFIIGLKIDWLLYFSIISDIEFKHEFMGYLIGWCAPIIVFNYIYTWLLENSCWKVASRFELEPHHCVEALSKGLPFESVVNCIDILKYTQAFPKFQSWLYHPFGIVYCIATWHFYTTPVKLIMKTSRKNR